jgi:hypothetical protein
MVMDFHHGDHMHGLTCRKKISCEAAAATPSAFSKLIKIVGNVGEIGGKL